MGWSKYPVFTEKGFAERARKYRTNSTVPVRVQYQTQHRHGLLVRLASIWLAPRRYPISPTWGNAMPFQMARQGEEMYSGCGSHHKRMTARMEKGRFRQDIMMTNWWVALDNESVGIQESGHCSHIAPYSFWFLSYKDDDVVPFVEGG